MKPEYKLMPKIIHYNIALTRSEKEFKLSNAEFLYIMTNSIMIDVVECIWNKMVAFKEKSPPSSNMLFVAIVSQLCKMDGVSIMVGDGLLLPPIGPNYNDISQKKHSNTSPSDSTNKNSWYSINFLSTPTKKAKIMEG